MKKQIILMSGAALAALALAMPAAAQEAPAAAQQVDDNSAQPGDIIVTAQKRSERLQDVPVAVSVVSGETLANSGAVNIENAQYLVPTLNFRKSGTALNQSLFLRGVGTSTFSIAGEPSITTVVDGVVYQRAGEAFSDLVDIDRLEVLRGPQGTLFGKNSSAGVINITTKRPGDSYAGTIEGGFYFGNANEYRLRAALDLPIAGDLLSARITGSYSTYEGNITNTVYNTRVNGYEHGGIRGVFVSKPSDKLTLTIIGDWHRNTDDCCAEAIGTAPSAASLAGSVLPTPRGDQTRAVAQNLITRTIEEGWGFSGQADLEVGSHTLTSITAYRVWNNNEIRDGDFLPQGYVGLTQLHDVGPQQTDTFTQELRLTSPSGGTFDYVVGAFYSHAYSQRTFTRNDIVCTATPTPTVLTPCSTPGLTVTQPNGSAFFGSAFDNVAVFGQATWHITPKLRLLGGIRFTHDELSVFHSRVSPLTGPGIQPNFDQGVYDRYVQLVAGGVSPTTAQTQAVAASNGVPFRTSTKNDNVSGKVGLQYDIVPQSTAYFTYSRGYKGPAYNIFYNLTATGTNVIEPETSNSFELGLKNTLFGGKLVLNLAAYYAKYDNFQANNPDVVAGVLVTRFTNAGKISTRGFELDAIYRPMADLSFSGGLAYTDAHVDQFRVPTNGVVTGVVPSGTTLAYAPRWKASLGGNYRYRSGGPLDFEFGVQSAYQSSQLSQFDASAAIRAATTIRPYALVDLQLAIVDPKDKFRLGFVVKNLLDESFAASITSGGPGGSYRYIIPREADRYYGVTARVNF